MCEAVATYSSKADISCCAQISHFGLCKQQEQRGRDQHVRRDRNQHRLSLALAVVCPLPSRRPVRPIHHATLRAPALQRQQLAHAVRERLARLRAAPSTLQSTFPLLRQVRRAVEVRAKDDERDQNRAVPCLIESKCTSSACCWARPGAPLDWPVPAPLCVDFGDNFLGDDYLAAASHQLVGPRALRGTGQRKGVDCQGGDTVFDGDAGKADHSSDGELYEHISVRGPSIQSRKCYRAGIG
ncbi:hypothetical protein FA95DRAFT_321161 [Auriscalpium vulgare]|uniref:Uncharacterized protein n=1 Tax=Auriscalpium vulgare TaxID=40419 RepID=A0ACB8S5B7_9AGAM|nr:hypothetical protein FA95DRAFT_321161 [Auriscalpium vulgare]